MAFKPLSPLPATAAPRIYGSTVPSVPIVERSVYTHLFASDGPNLVGEFPGSAPAFIDSVSGTTITRADLKLLTLAFGYGIRNHPRIAAKRGDTVLIYSPNSLCWPVVLLGSVAAGLRCTLANNANNSRELANQYTDSGAMLILTSEDGIVTAQETLRNLGLTEDQISRRIVVLGSSLGWVGGPTAPRKPEVRRFVHLEDLLTMGTLKEEEKFDGALAHETVYLCYSSGTTGKPKGVETTHQNVTANLDTLRPLFPTPKSSTLGVLPFYHMFGLVNILHFPFMCGVPVIIQQKFDPIQFCANLEKYKISIAIAVPPILLHLSRHPAVDKYDISSLEVLLCGAAPLGAGVANAVSQRLLAKRDGKRNLSVLQAYGLTEMSGLTHVVPVGDDMRKSGSIGVLMPNLQARIIAEGEDNDLDASEGQPGELWIKGPIVMKAYLGNKAATAEAVTPNGWFKTGDIAKRDDEGFYYIVDRRKEFIKYKGSQVAPAELESVLLTHPDIADAAVIGIESTREATELPRAYIVHAKPEAIRDEHKKVVFCRDIGSWIQKQVARHKYLRGGVFAIDIIPKSASGKILRKELKQRAKQEFEKQGLADWGKAKL